MTDTATRPALNILIVDDEPLARQRLSALVSDIRADACVLTAESVADARVRMDEYASPVDLILLDIEMPGTNGLDWLDELQQALQPPAVILTTAWADYALPALQRGADGYLLKPVKASELTTALDRARKHNRLQQGATTRTVALNTRGTRDFLRLEDLCYLTAEDGWVSVVSRHNQHVSDRPLRDWEALLGDQVLRVHRSYVVNPDAIQSLKREGNQIVVILSNGASLPISRRHLRSVRERLIRQ